MTFLSFSSSFQFLHFNLCLGDVDPPVTYGLSHANGTMERYGPYGVYRKPKRPDQPFEPGKPESKSDNSRHSSRSSSCSCQDVLRLTGGGLFDDKQYSPILACKPLMEDFDKVRIIFPYFHFIAYFLT